MWVIAFRISARPAETRDITEVWLTKHVGISDIPVFFMEGMPKGEAVKYFFGEEAIRNCRWVIFEDDPYEISSYLNIIKKVIKIFISDWPYNRNITKGYRLGIDTVGLIK